MMNPIFARSITLTFMLLLLSACSHEAPVGAQRA